MNTVKVRPLYFTAIVRYSVRIRIACESLTVSSVSFSMVMSSLDFSGILSKANMTLLVRHQVSSYLLALKIRSILVRVVKKG